MISALYVREDSVYKALGIDCWDIQRDARLWPGGNPVIAHPPCRAWGKLKHFAKPRPGEKELAKLAVSQIRMHGGVLEHPYGSTLFRELLMPKAGCYDFYGGYTIEIDQYHFGHKAEKKTWLYIVGCPLSQLPKIPKRIGVPEMVVSSSKYRKGQVGFRKRITNKEREQTPIKLAEWLMEVANKINNLNNDPKANRNGKGAFS